MTDLYRAIEAQIPSLRRYALALTRNAVSADDLVQDCLVRAIAKQHLWGEGTNLRAWLFTILHNQYVNSVRRSVREGPTVEMGENEVRLGRPADQEKRLELRDLDCALAKLPTGQRTVILLIGLEAMSYQQVADIMGVPAGTVRSRLSRGREALRELMGITTANRPEALPANWRRAARRRYRPSTRTPAAA